MLDRFDDQSIGVERLSIHSPDLDDVFFALTGHSGRDVPSAGSRADDRTDEKAALR